MALPHRLLVHEADIKRPQESNATGTDALDATPGEPQTVAEGLACYFEDSQTQFVREDDGQRATKPATVTFSGGPNVREGDLVDVDVVDTPLEVRRIRKLRTGIGVEGTECEVERAS